jgi:hypothetical protein
MSKKYINVCLIVTSFMLSGFSPSSVRGAQEEQSGSLRKCTDGCIQEAVLRWQWCALGDISQDECRLLANIVLATYLHLRVIYATQSHLMPFIGHAYNTYAPSNDGTADIDGHLKALTEECNQLVLLQETWRSYSTFRDACNVYHGEHEREYVRVKPAIEQLNASISDLFVLLADDLHPHVSEVEKSISHMTSTLHAICDVIYKREYKNNVDQIDTLARVKEACIASTANILGTQLDIMRLQLGFIDMTLCTLCRAYETVYKKLDPEYRTILETVQSEKNSLGKDLPTPDMLLK